MKWLRRAEARERVRRGARSGTPWPRASFLPGAIRGSNVTLAATGLTRLTYPVVIDPSILINSSDGFLTGNNEGDLNLTNNQFGEGGLTGGAVGGWTASTSTTNGSLPTATDYDTSVAYNGYVYEIGGGYTGNETAVVDYAALSGTGALAAPGTCSGTLTDDWYASTSTANGSLPAGTASATSVAYNGYIYEIGGYTSSASAVVEYAELSSTGALAAPGTCSGTLTGDWYASTSTANGSLPAATDIATSVAYNGYVYEIGGYTGGSPTAVVDYAALSGTGALAAPGSCAGTLTGDWCASTSTANGSLPALTDYATSVAYNGYVYEIGGDITGYTAVVDYVAIRPAGYTSSYNSTTSLPTATDSAASVAYNGYIYGIGGYNGSANVATVEYASINSNGTLGSWTAGGGERQLRPLGRAGAIRGERAAYARLRGATDRQGARKPFGQGPPRKIRTCILFVPRF